MTITLSLAGLARQRSGRMATAFAATLIAVAPPVAAQAPKPDAAVHYAPSRAVVESSAHVAITDIIGRMNHAIDANDYETYAAFYADDGYIDSGFGPLSRGRAEIVASLEQSAPFITNKRHVASNIVINGAGDRYTAVYYLTVFERVAGLTLAGTALITDTFVRRNGRWAVASHQTRMDPATLNAMQSAMRAPTSKP
jgi:uncharacterized protein (TIGR02246 family)